MRLDGVMSRRLAQELNLEREALDRVLDAYRRAARGDSTFELQARTSIIVDLSTAAQRIFTRIADAFDGGGPQGGLWNLELLKQMARPRDERRPAVIDRGLAEELEEFLRFRHAVQANESAERRKARVEKLESSLPRIIAELQAHIARLIDWIELIAMQNRESTSGPER